MFPQNTQHNIFIHVFYQINDIFVSESSCNAGWQYWESFGNNYYSNNNYVVTPHFYIQYIILRVVMDLLHLNSKINYNSIEERSGVGKIARCDFEML